MTNSNSPLGRGKIGVRSGQRLKAWLVTGALAATLLAVVLGLAIGKAAATALGSGPQPSPSLDLAEVDRFVQGELGVSSLPGAALAITRGDKVLHLRGYGHDAAGAAITGTSLFRIASLRSRSPRWR